MDVHLMNGLLNQMFMSFNQIEIKFITIGLMTSQSVELCEQQKLFECPICLSTLVYPITLTCGHTYCQTCIKSKNFSIVKQRCPLCRKSIACDIDIFSSNILLQELLKAKFGGQISYQQRLAFSALIMRERNIGFIDRIKKWIKEKLPWIIILVLLYHLFKVKINFFSHKFKDYKDKAVSVANSIQVENSLDFKFLLFSQFMKLLFSTIVIP